jgi:hypothetical protein
MVEKKLYAIVEALGEEFGFDPDEAMEVVAEQAEELYAFFASLAPKPKKGGEAKEEVKGGGAVEEDEAVKKTRHNIELWEKKLEKGDFKDKSAHEAKIAKEKAKLEKMLKASAPAPAKKKEEAPAKKEEKKAVKEEKPTKREKRIKKMSPVISGQLAKALESEGMQITDEFKKKFQNEYIEGLSDKDYNEQGLADHARNFAKTVKCGGARPPPSCPLAHLLESVKKGNQQMPGGGGNLPECNCGKCPSDEKETPEPEAQEDEDLMEVDFKGKTYAVSKLSGNVYEEQDGRDVAVGFVGIGKFKELVLPQ